MCIHACKRLGAWINNIIRFSTIKASLGVTIYDIDIGLSLRICACTYLDMAPELLWTTTMLVLSIGCVDLCNGKQQ